MKIRKAVEEDSDKVWVLMRDLAVFEKYIDVFAITPEIVKEKRIPPKSARFSLYCGRRQ